MAEYDPLKGYVFVFTGEMRMPREEAQNRVVMLGARTTTAVSSKTTHLVTGEEPGPSKVAKAKECNVKIINEDEFNELLKKHDFKGDTVISTNVNPPSEGNENKLISEVKDACNDESEYTCSSSMSDLHTPLNIKSWAEKYRPMRRIEFIGNPGALEQLDNFLKGGSQFKAALLSGSPGVGKTTAAHLLCKENGFEVFEFNASDLRNKSSIAEHVGSFMNNFSLNKKLEINKKAIIMDEVDGMTSDRGGIPELVNIIKKTKVPFICICNDRVHQKMRTLSNYCEDIRFKRLDSRTILPKVKNILEHEGKRLTDGIINEVILNSHGDMRYILNTIQNITSNDSIDLKSVSKSIVKKNVAKNTFEIVAEMFQNNSIDSKTNIFFEDYSILPLFIHENYLKCKFTGLKELSKASDSISFSDLQDSKIHGSEQEWSLLPYFAFSSCIYPTKGVSLMSRIDFPGYLGQMSKMKKHSRLLGEFNFHSSVKNSKSDLRLFSGELVYKKFMKELESGNINNCIKILVEMNVSKDDIINLEEVFNLELFKKVPAKIKTSLSKECKKLNIYLPTIEDNEEEED